LFLKTDGAGNLSFDSLSFSTPLAVIGNATAGSEIRLPEDTDNGSNYVALKAPDTLSADLTLTLPSADGTSGQVLQTNGSGVLSFSSPSAGITEADQWRITTDRSGTGDITANWERNDTDFDKIGTGMTESSGIFTFPATGIYLVTMNATGDNSSASLYTQIAINTTVDNSNYNVRGLNYTAFYSNAICGWSVNIIFDVTSTTNCKVKFSIPQNQAGTINLMGNTTQNRTYATFIRLGDT
jgi:hypothetical protein